MTDEIKQAYDRCLQAFIKCDYTACVLEGRPLITKWITLPLLQMYLISIQRLGHPRQAEEFGSQFVSMESNLDAWSKTLLKLTFSRARPAEIVAELGNLQGQTQDNKQRCQLMYYVGAKWLTLGVKEYAQACFGASTPEQLDELHALMTKYAQGCFTIAAAIDAPCIEQQLAVAACDSLDPET